MASRSRSHTPPTRAHSPVPVLLVGLACLVAWVIGSLLDIQTSEAFLLKGPVVTFSPDWSILGQIPALIGGHLTPEMAKAAMYGWGIELIYLVCIVGFEVAHEGVKASNRTLASWFRTGAIALVAFNAYMSVQYGNLASGFWGQVGFALITAFVVAFCGLVGFRFIEYAIGEWSR